MTVWHACVSWADVQLCLQDMRNMLAYVQWYITVNLVAHAHPSFSLSVS